MKSQKTLKKKLVLTKTNIADLNHAELNKVYGGAWEKTIDATVCVTNCTACPSMRICL
jgi:hypothetical protein